MRGTIGHFKRKEFPFRPVIPKFAINLRAIFLFPGNGGESGLREGDQDARFSNISRTTAEEAGEIPA